MDFRILRSVAKVRRNLVFFRACCLKLREIANECSNERAEVSAGCRGARLPLLAPRGRGRFVAALLCADKLDVEEEGLIHVVDLEARELGEDASGRQTLEGSFSAVSKPNLANKYAFESSRRDLHSALLCTAL